MKNWARSNALHSLILLWVDSCVDCSCCTLFSKVVHLHSLAIDRKQCLISSVHSRWWKSVKRTAFDLQLHLDDCSIATRVLSKSEDSIAFNAIELFLWSDCLFGCWKFQALYFAFSFARDLESSFPYEIDPHKKVDNGNGSKGSQTNRNNRILAALNLISILWDANEQWKAKEQKTSAASPFFIPAALFSIHSLSHFPKRLIASVVPFPGFPNIFNLINKEWKFLF